MSKSASIEFALYSISDKQWALQAGTLFSRLGTKQLWFKRFYHPGKDATDLSKKVAEKRAWSKARYTFVHKMFADNDASIAELLQMRAEAGISATMQAESPEDVVKLTLTITINDDGSVETQTPGSWHKYSGGEDNTWTAVSCAADSVARMLDYYFECPARQEES